MYNSHTKYVCNCLYVAHTIHFFVRVNISLVDTFNHIWPYTSNTFVIVRVNTYTYTIWLRLWHMGMHILQCRQCFICTQFICSTYIKYTRCTDNTYARHYNMNDYVLYVCTYRVHIQMYFTHILCYYTHRTTWLIANTIVHTKMACVYM